LWVNYDHNNSDKKIQIKVLFLSALQAVLNNELSNGTVSQFGKLKAFSLSINKSILLKIIFFAMQFYEVSNN